MGSSGQTPCQSEGKAAGLPAFYAAVAKGWRSKLYFVPPSPRVGSGKAKGDRAFESTDYERFMVGLDRELRRHFDGQLFNIIRDRASQHIKAEKYAVLSALNLPIVVDYPAQSWDINCIEHVWAHLVNQTGDTGLSQPTDCGALCALAGGQSSSRPLTFWLTMCPIGSRGLGNLKGSGLGPTLRDFPSEFELAI